MGHASYCKIIGKSRDPKRECFHRGKGPNCVHCSEQEVPQSKPGVPCVMAAHWPSCDSFTLSGPLRGGGRWKPCFLLLESRVAETINVTSGSFGGSEISERWYASSPCWPPGSMSVRFPLYLPANPEKSQLRGTV